MPSDEVASEVITSDDPGDDAIMTSDEVMTSADVTSDATDCVGMATNEADDGDIQRSRPWCHDICRSRLCLNPCWLGWMPLCALLCLCLLHHGPLSMDAI